MTEWLLGWWTWFWGWSADGDNRDRVLFLIAVLTAIFAVLKFVAAPIVRTQKTKPDQQSLTPAQTAALLEEHTKRLTTRIAELERQLAASRDPDARGHVSDELTAARQRLAEAEDRVAELAAENLRQQQEFTAAGQELDEPRFEAARRAIATPDTEKAISILEGISTGGAEAAATAEFMLGEIAEKEIRWSDAARHYARAVDLAPDMDRLFKACEFAWRAGDYGAAEQLGVRLVAQARDGGDQKQIAAALNDHALTLMDQGKLAEAEGLYREALKIDAATIGTQHPDYATDLNNLAVLLTLDNRPAEAEPLMAEALAIREATLPPDHPYIAQARDDLTTIRAALPSP